MFPRRSKLALGRSSLILLQKRRLSKVFSDCRCSVRSEHFPQYRYLLSLQQPSIGPSHTCCREAGSERNTVSLTPSHTTVSLTPSHTHETKAEVRFPPSRHEVFATVAESERPQRTAGRYCIADFRTAVHAIGAHIGG